MSEKNLGESLRKIRQSFNFSQEQIAEYLEINRASVVLLEGGKREVKYEELKKLAELYEITIDSIENSTNLKHITNSTLNKNKFKNVLYYILSECGANPNVGKTVIYKLLYFTDFGFYKKFGKYLTGIKYVKFPRGPVPYKFDELVNEMIEAGELVNITTKFYGKPQYKLIPNKENENLNLSDEEKEFINNIIKEYGNKNATDISELSHKEMPWIVTPDYCEIDYELINKF